jgi:hypothetical protein
MILWVILLRPPMKKQRYQRKKEIIVNIKKSSCDSSLDYTVILKLSETIPAVDFQIKRVIMTIVNMNNNADIERDEIILEAAHVRSNSS